MQLKNLQLKNFRCFEQLSLNLDSRLILIEGNNGSGKTSILEALSYLCFLKSFRTHITKELIKENCSNFFIKADFYHSGNNEVQVGFSSKKRLVKINGKSVQSYKDILNYYRIVTLTEDDLNLIQGNPEVRRTFIDQHLMLTDSQHLHLFRKYKNILDNRNALLKKGSCKYDDYLLWTKALWQQAQIIQALRIKALEEIGVELNKLVNQTFDQIDITFSYEPKIDLIHEDFDTFLADNNGLYESEQYFKRSLFGTHLDDFSIKYLSRKSKSFASRGQQKLITVLTKIAQINILAKNNIDRAIVFLLDDFMTDFDAQRLQTLVDLLCSLNIQLIFTSPNSQDSLKGLLIAKNAYLLQV